MPTRKTAGPAPGENGGRTSYNDLYESQASRELSEMEKQNMESLKLEARIALQTDLQRQLQENNGGINYRRMQQTLLELAAGLKKFVYAGVEIKSLEEPGAFIDINWRHVFLKLLPCLREGFKLRTSYRAKKDTHPLLKVNKSTSADWAQEHYDALVAVRHSLERDDSDCIKNDPIGPASISQMYKGAQSLYVQTRFTGQYNVARKDDQPPILLYRQHGIHDGVYAALMRHAATRRSALGLDKEPDVSQNSRVSLYDAEGHAKVIFQILQFPVTFKMAKNLFVTSSKWAHMARSDDLMGLKLASMYVDETSMTRIMKRNSSQTKNPYGYKLLVFYLGERAAGNGSMHYIHKYAARSRDSSQCVFFALGLYLYVRFEKSSADFEFDEDASCAPIHRWYNQWLVMNEQNPYAEKGRHVAASLITSQLKKAGLHSKATKSRHAQRRGSSQEQQLGFGLTTPEISEGLGHATAHKQVTWANYTTDIPVRSLLAAAGFKDSEIVRIPHALARKDLETTEFRPLLESALHPVVLKYLQLTGKALDAKIEENRPGFHKALGVLLECGKCFIESAADLWNSGKRGLPLFKLPVFRDALFVKFAATLEKRMTESTAAKLHQVEECAQNGDLREGFISLSSALNSMSNDIRHGFDRITKKAESSEPAAKSDTYGEACSSSANSGPSEPSLQDNLRFDKLHLWPKLQNGKCDTKCLSQLPKERYYCINTDIQTLEDVYKQCHEGFRQFPGLLQMNEAFGNIWRSYAEFVTLGQKRSAFGQHIKIILRIGRFIDAHGVANAREQMRSWALQHMNLPSSGSEFHENWSIMSRFIKVAANKRGSSSTSTSSVRAEKRARR